MIIDIKKFTALPGVQNVSLIDGLVNSGMQLKYFILQCWETHLLRCAIRSERKTLGTLSDRELEDMGINRVDAVAESQKRYNDLPVNRVND